MGGATHLPPEEPPSVHGQCWEGLSACSPEKLGSPGVQGTGKGQALCLTVASPSPYPGFPGWDWSEE